MVRGASSSPAPHLPAGNNVLTSISGNRNFRIALDSSNILCINHEQYDACLETVARRISFPLGVGFLHALSPSLVHGQERGGSGDVDEHSSGGGGASNFVSSVAFVVPSMSTAPRYWMSTSVNSQFIIVLRIEQMTSE